MAATVVTSPYSSILDLTGVGLSLGSVYVGAPNQDPQVTPQAVYWDAALTIPATQPLQVSAGYIMRLGAPSVVFTSGDYSIRALDHNGAQVFYRATSVNVATTPPARTLLTANTDLYVATTGSDTTGTGSAGAPWATIQKAFNVLMAGYDLGGFVVTIHVGAGTFAAAGLNAPLPGALAGAGSVVLSGAGVGSTTVQGTALLPALSASYGGAFSVGGMTISGGIYGLQATLGGTIAYGTVTFGAVTQAHLNTSYQGVIVCIGSYTISGAAACHYFAYGGVWGHFGGPYVCTLTGTPAFSGAFVSVGANAVASPQASWLTFVGSATGQRYGASTNSTIDTFGSGANYLPGNAAGVTASNGVYT